jgi:hypothetical protein
LVSCVIDLILLSSYFSHLTDIEKYDKFPNTHISSYPGLASIPNYSG